MLEYTQIIPTEEGYYFMLHSVPGIMNSEHVIRLQFNKNKKLLLTMKGDADTSNGVLLSDFDSKYLWWAGPLSPTFFPNPFGTRYD